jgi:hypothetical protein
MSERVKVTSKTPESKRDNSVSQKQGTNLSHPLRSPVNQILFLQRTIGNQAVQRLFKVGGGQRSAVGGRTQAKLKIGQPGDIYEQEADRVAEQVMRMPEPQLRRQPEEEEEEEELLQTKSLAKPTPQLLQRQAEEEKKEELIQTKAPSEQITPLVQRQVEEEKEEEEILQTKKREGTTPEVTHAFESSINALKGGGQPLPESVHAYFEPRFGYDFTGVRVHTDAKAAESAQAVNAMAYTVGSDVVFGAQQYAPGTYAGNHLLAHELTHTVQQGSNVPRSQHKIVGSQIVDTPEMEDAEDASIRVLKRSSATIQSMPASYSAKLIQREADKPTIKTSNDAALRQRVVNCAQEATGYGIKAKSFDANGKRVGWRKLDLIFWVAYGEDTTKYDEKAIKKKKAGPKAFREKESGKIVQKEVSDRIVDWCGIFAVYVLKSAGVQVGNWSGNLSYLLRQIPPGTLPKKGDIAYRIKNHHMAVVTEVGSGNNPMITTVNGNSTNGEIREKTEPKNGWHAFYDISKPRKIKQKKSIK